MSIDKRPHSITGVGMILALRTSLALVEKVITKNYCIKSSTLPGNANN